MNLDSNLYGSLHRQKAERPLVKGQRAIGGILNHNNLVLLCKFNHRLVEVFCCNRSGRIIGVIQIKQLCLLQHRSRNGAQIRKKMILPQQRQRVHTAAQPLCFRPENRVARHGHQRNIARIDEGLWDHRQRGFRTHGMQNLRFRAQPAHAEHFFQIGRRGLLEQQNSVIRVPPVLPFLRLLIQNVDHRGVRHGVRLAHT